MTKKYIINGVEIEKLEPSRFAGYEMGLQALAGCVYQLLDALDEKKEEPKSILREEIKYLVTHTGPTTEDSLLRVTDKIISLFKDTLLKEIDDQPDWNTLTKFIKNL